MQGPHSLLFVCSGNICRSPAAEALARAALDQAGLRQVRTASCGTLRIAGEPAAPFTRRALAERGIDLGGFRSRALSHFLLREADLVICMEDHHREAVLWELGGDADLLSHGVRVITEYHPEERWRNDAGIYDFVEAPWEEYAEGIAEIEACVRGLVSGWGG
jgi:protein-tyrosine-phosphatase